MENAFWKLYLESYIQFMDMSRQFAEELSKCHTQHEEWAVRKKQLS
jgi:hypothetical protein